MIETSDSLRCVFSASVRERDGSYVLEIPSSKIEHGTITVDDTYRIAIFESSVYPAPSKRANSGFEGSQPSSSRGSSEPPVDEGEVREVTIETVGDQGDGIAKVERGFVVIIPGAQPGQQLAAKSVLVENTPNLLLPVGSTALTTKLTTIRLSNGHMTKKRNPKSKCSFNH